MEKELPTLADLFEGIDGQYYGSRNELMIVVCDVVINPNIGILPIGFSYKDAVAGALANGWLKTNPDGTPGVRIDLRKEEGTD